DGTKDGYDVQLTRAVVDAVAIPVIASGGVGTLEHVRDGLSIAGADAALAASIFHDGIYTVAEVKDFLQRAAAHVRPPTAAQRAVPHQASGAGAGRGASRQRSSCSRSNVEKPASPRRSVPSSCSRPAKQCSRTA